MNHNRHHRHKAPEHRTPSYKQEMQGFEQLATRLQESATAAEQVIRPFLAAQGFRFQQTFHGRFIVDFLHRRQKLIVEIDGDYHNTSVQRYEDGKRSEVLQAFGYRVIRFSNDEVLTDPIAVARKVCAQFRVKGVRL